MTQTDTAPMAELLFRNARGDEADTVLALYRSVLGRPFCTWNEEYPGPEEVRRDLEAGNLFVLESAGGIIGAVSVAPENELDNVIPWLSRGIAGEFARVVIAPAYQGRGLARVLVADVLRVMASRGIETAHISVAKVNPPARATYRGLGFIAVGEKKMWGHDFLLCERPTVPGEKATGIALARIAQAQARLPYRGGADTNIAPLIARFPQWSVPAADGLWCAAFVYHCCRLAGFDFPYSPDECVTCSLAGCGGWEEFALGDSRVRYLTAEEAPAPGDIVLYDRVFNGTEHDHIGIVLSVSAGWLTVAEGNVGNRSGIVLRPRDAHIRAFIRLPEGFRYTR